MLVIKIPFKLVVSREIIEVRGLTLASHSKLTYIFVNCDENKKIFSCKFVSLSASSLVVYCL